MSLCNWERPCCAYTPVISQVALGHIINRSNTSVEPCCIYADPHQVFKIIRRMHLDIEDRFLFKCFVTEKCIIVCIEPNTGICFGIYSIKAFGYPDFGFEPPAMTADIDQFILVIQTGWHTGDEAYTDDGLLCVLRKLPFIQWRGTGKINTQSYSCISKSDSGTGGVPAVYLQLTQHIYKWNDHLHPCQFICQTE